MGWGSGSDLMCEVMREAKKKMSKDEREKMYRILIPAMEAYDWDTQFDCFEVDEVYDKIILEMYPDE